MDKVNKQELRRLAGMATPGPWYAGATQDCYCVASSASFAVYAECSVRNWAPPKDDIEFIAAANPAAILSLLDELEQYRKDAQRLEWMLAEQCIIRAQNGTGFPSVFSLWWVSLHEGQREWYATERDAIDAAMAKEGGANG